ncbi:DUF1461 domain-containing protein [Candidatus Woesearchaeota archaeon]|nr:DUF1461 domain-containing protein [Candidatus Woesearchaeota archaeon]
MRSSWLFVIPLAFVLAQVVFLANFRALVFDMSFYDAEFVKLGVYGRLPEAGDVARDIVLFHQGRKESIDSWAFSDEEMQHLRDVRAAIRKATGYLYLLVLVSVALAAVLFLHSADRKSFLSELSRVFLLSGLLVIAACAFFVVSAAGFSSSFEAFHRLFFAEGSYTFSGAGSLVDFFPEGLFMDFFLRVVAASAVTGVALVALYFFVRRSASMS